MADGGESDSLLVRVVGLAVLLLAISLVAGCSSLLEGQKTSAAPETDFKDLATRPSPPPPPLSSRSNPRRTVEARPLPSIFYGDNSSAVTNVPAGAADSDSDPPTTGTVTQGVQANAKEGYELNFENTPIATVAKSILGDILGLGYTIDPRVQSSISLSSGRAVARKDLLFALESALRANNIAMLREGTTYRLVPAADAIGSGCYTNRKAPRQATVSASFRCNTSRRRC